MNPNINYDRNYLNGMRLLAKASSACEKTLPEIVYPTLILQSSRDPIVDPESAATISSSLKRIVTIDTDSHLIVTDESREKVIAESLDFIDTLKSAISTNSHHKETHSG